MKEKLPRHFQRVRETGKLRIAIKVPEACRSNLPGGFKDKAYLIHHLGTSDIKSAERKERQEGVIDKFTRLIEAARPVPTKWAYVPPSAIEIERMRILLEGFMGADPQTLTERGRESYESLKSGITTPVVEGRYEEVPITATGTALSFDDGVDLWADEKLVPPPTRRSYKDRMEMLAKKVGHDNANLITRQNIIDWKDDLVRSGLASKTIKNYVGNICTIFRYLADNEKIDNNPVEKSITYTVRKDPRKTRLDLEPADRLAIYKAALAETRPLYKWSNLLMLFTGMRPEEFSEADTRDIRQVDGVWCFLLDYDYRAQEHMLKTDESIRKIPLHSAVLKAGFLNYVNSLKPGLLFPMLKADRDGRLATDASRKLSVWLRESAEITDPRKVNYSHRHTVISIMCNLGVRESTARKIAGHAGKTIHDDYIHHSVAALKAAVEKIPVPEPVAEASRIDGFNGVNRDEEAAS